MSKIQNIVYLAEDRRMEIDRFLIEWMNNSLTIKVNSSGSTGSAKSIELTKENMLISARKTIEFFGLKKGGTAYICLSTDTIAGKMMIVRAIVNEMKLVVGPVSSNALSLIDERAELVAAVPLQIQYALENNPSKISLIDTLIIGGAPISSTIEKQIIDKDLTVWQSYGMTETISHVALRKIGKNGGEFYSAIPNVHFSIGKNENLIIHYPEIGQLSLETTDLVELKSPTSFKWIGRTDFIINSGGMKIHPEKIESILSKEIEIPFFIAGLPDEKLGQKIVLVIESAEPIKIESLNLRSILPKNQVPKEIICIQKFIRTASDKINRIETLKRSLNVA